MIRQILPISNAAAFSQGQNQHHSILTSETQHHRHILTRAGAVGLGQSPKLISDNFRSARVGVGMKISKIGKMRENSGRYLKVRSLQGLY
jgi:hypothetical protein